MSQSLPLIRKERRDKRVEEEDTFRTVSSKGQASNSEVEEEDDYVEDTDDDRDANSKKEENPMDDMENQKNKSSDDRAKNKEEEDVKSDNRDINGSHQHGLEEEPDLEKTPIQEKTVGESRNEESFNSIHGLESIVQDSQSPLIEECVESANHCSQIQNREAQQGKNQEQVKEKERVNDVGTNPVTWDSNVILRPSQV
ncbi:hypothetical protein RHGRI_018878 [Rhododendron griersonianum]|uniref:Uncharacterized protein n=1 Tax=Rhododendron griersonianum TaxID=479676 RepID=A0AAV6K3F1_9ERIC|nr:hypothetical protein RHGRI_018878 [Rhododendron griersonianum]